MKTNNLVLASLLAGGLLLGACSKRTMTNAGNRAEQTADKADAEWDRERAQLKQEIQQGLDDIDARLETLKANAKDASADTREGLDKQAKKLEKSRERMAGYMARLGEETRTGWQKFKLDVRSAFEEVKADLKD